ncbi:hypothetical protein [Halotalea alkalilenta]|uniref:Uncharacterized protein n=1 Tax=Halotalea alkalilenta TaxID=376489 RepID=A0A172YJ19_9GAMM|nr:hypothetical protein [Halotalea alkalilenta]ANF59162.1 hypothetical protein A5892_18235 [Halotalea alkalilenta]
MSVTQLSPITVYAKLGPTNSFGDLFMDDNFHAISSGRSVERQVAQILAANQAHYQGNRESIDPHYRDPESDQAVSEALIRQALSEFGNLPAYLAQTFGNLGPQGHSALKNFALINSSVIQFAGLGAALHHDLKQGTPTEVAVGTQAVMLAALVFTTAFTVMLPIPVAVALGLIFSGGFEYLEVEASVRDRMYDLFGREPESNDPHEISSEHFYEFSIEYLENPDELAERLPVIEAINTSLSEQMIEDFINAESADEKVELTSEFPSLIDFSEIAEDAQGDKQVQVADGAVLFLGDAGFNQMIGGDGINWFRPQPNEIANMASEIGAVEMALKYHIVGGTGLNILDFSGSSSSVYVELSGYPIKNDLIIDNPDGLNSLEIPYYLNEQNMQEIHPSMPRGLPMELRSDDIYENIDILIGSDHDDWLVGNLLGGTTLMGGAGDDVFEVRGGSNRVLFREGDFNDPGAESITSKTIHGFIGYAEAYWFNYISYIPNNLSFMHLEPDLIDLSGLDADLIREGIQEFEWIGDGEFSATPGELRWNREAMPANEMADSFMMVIEADRTGNGESDMEIVYYSYANTRVSWDDVIGVSIDADFIL